MGDVDVGAIGAVDEQFVAELGAVADELVVAVEGAVLDDHREVVDAVRVGQVEGGGLVVVDDEHAGNAAVDVGGRVAVGMGVIPQRRRRLVDRPRRAPRRLPDRSTGKGHHPSAPARSSRANASSSPRRHRCAPTPPRCHHARLAASGRGTCRSRPTSRSPPRRGTVSCPPGRPTRSARHRRHRAHRRATRGSAVGCRTPADVRASGASRVGVRAPRCVNDSVAAVAPKQESFAEVQSSNSREDQHGAGRPGVDAGTACGWNAGRRVSVRRP